MTVRRLSTAVLSIIICISLSLDIFAFSIPVKEGFVADSANVLSQETEEQIAEIGNYLKDSCGCDLAVLTQRSVDGSMKDYSAAVFEEWDLSSKAALVVLNIHEQSYYVLLGSVAQENFTQSDINNMLLDHMEPYFAEENYDAGTIALCTELKEELGELYYVEPEVSEEEAEEKESSGFVKFLQGLLKFILILAAMLALVVGFIYARGEYLKVRRIRQQRRDEILSGTAPSSYVPRREEPEEVKETPEEEPLAFSSYNFDEKFEVDMNRDFSTPEDPETKEFDFYKTYSSTKYDFETFSKRK